MNDSAKIQHFSLKNNSCPESRASLSRISCILVPTYRQLRPDAPPVASPRIAFCVGTQKAARRHAVLGASGAQLLAMWVKLVDRRKGKNVNVNVNLKCFSMLPEGEAYNRV